MTTFKVFETDGYIEYTVKEYNITKAVRILRRVFGKDVRFVIVA